MRVIAGKYQRKTIINNRDYSIRPTMDRAKEGLFNIINSNIYDATFLDLFTGTGNMGIEALSRGAKHVTFVDSSRKSIEIANKNLEGITESYTIATMDALSFLEKTENIYDYIFLDPPYDINLEYVEKLIQESMKKICDNGVIIVELPREFNSEKYEYYRVKKYGKSKFTFFRKENND